MVKKSTKKKNIKSRLKSLSKPKLIILLIILIIIILFLFNFIIASIEKNNLLEKYKKLDIVAQKIETQYPPDSKISERYCDHQNRKYEKGPTYCVYSIDLTYKVRDIADANNIKNRISVIVSAEKLRNYIGGDTNFLKNSNETNQDELANSGYIVQDFIDDKLVKCSISYKFKTDDLYTVNVKLNCSDPTKKEYFPVKN